MFSLLNAILAAAVIKIPGAMQVHVLCRIFGGSLQVGNGTWGREREMKGKREGVDGIRALQGRCKADRSRWLPAT